MLNPFPASIRKVGIFPLSFGFQKQEYIDTLKQKFAELNVNYEMPEPQTPELRYMAADDEERARIFNSLLADETVDFLFAMRGGFGAARALPYIDWDLLLKRNIPVAGYSDMSAFLAGALSKGFKNGISGIMAECTFGCKASEQQIEQSYASMRKCIEGKVLSVPYQGDYTTITQGQVTAPLMAGNLGVLQALIGTPWMPDLSGYVLILEDLSKPAVEIERAFNHFYQAGIFGVLSGIVFGSFSGCNDMACLSELFREYASYVKGPSFSGLPFGHIFPCAAIRLGVETTISVAPEGKVAF
ncbi:MAG: LD-carboxypeptidase [Victivallales bacterium]|nr:LD-carboxypeptidase [Victivallales bacterium]